MALGWFGRPKRDKVRDSSDPYILSKRPMVDKGEGKIFLDSLLVRPDNKPMLKYESDLIKRLKEVKERRMLTQEAIAKELGLSVYTIYRWLRGKNIPMGLSALALEKFLKKDLV